MNLYLGTRLLASEVAPLGEERQSIAFFCPTCGNVWGRAVRESGWYALARPCLSHATPYSVGGSFYQDFDWFRGGYKETLARHPALAVWEFQAHLAWAERFINAGEPAFQQELGI